MLNKTILNLFTVFAVFALVAGCKSNVDKGLEEPVPEQVVEKPTLPDKLEFTTLLGNNKKINYIGSFNNTLFKISAKDNTLATVANPGRLHSSTDNGATYTISNEFVNPTIIKVDAIFPTEYYVGTTAHGIYKSKNSGNDYQQIDTSVGLPSNKINDLYVGSRLIAAGTDAGFAWSIDGGESFSVISTASNNPIPENEIISVFYQNSYFYLLSKGNLRERHVFSDTDSNDYSVGDITGDNSASLNCIYIDNSTFPVYTIYVGTSVGIAISTDAGDSFSMKFSGLSNSNVTSIFAEGERVYLGTSDGMAISADSGASFTQPMDNDEFGVINNITYDGANIYAATQTRGMLTSTDDGVNFTSDVDSNTLPNNFVYGVRPTGNRLYVATNAGLAYADKSPEKSFAESNLQFNHLGLENGLPQISTLGVNVSKSGNTVYVNTLVGLYISRDRAETFTLINSGTHANYPANNAFTVTFRGDPEKGGRIYVGTSGGLAYSDDNGLNWFNFNESPGFPATLIISAYDDGNGNIYAGTWAGLAVSRDNGITFNIKTTAHGLPSNGTYFVTGIDDKIFVATRGQGFAYSSNKGETFCYANTSGGSDNEDFNCEGNSYIQGNEVYGINVFNDVLYITTVGGGVEYSEDWGQTFKSVGLAEEFKYGVASNKLPNNVFLGLTISDDGKIFLGSNGTGVVVSEWIEQSQESN